MVLFSFVFFHSVQNGRGDPGLQNGDTGVRLEASSGDHLRVGAVGHPQLASTPHSKHASLPHPARQVGAGYGGQVEQGEHEVIVQHMVSWYIYFFFV